MGSISQVYDASFDMWANKRRQELIDMGYTERQANKIIDEEGKKRFRIKKAIAYTETVVSTFAAAQQAYASQMALATPDAPIRAKIAAAAAIAAGLARAAAIKAQQIGGGGGGGVGAPGAPTGNYGVQTTGGGTIGMSIRQGASDSLVTSSSVRRDSAELASLREEVSSMRAEMVDATRSLASRPNEIVVTPSTSGALVRIGSDANANRAR